MSYGLGGGGIDAITLDCVWKRFSLIGRRPRSVRELFRRERGGSEKPTDFWALRDVSIAIRKGETLGLIGANGSGKSTILKLISAIMRPTRGRVQVAGSVSALIELGAGFHPEFSGRDNVFIYGALLGLSRARIRRELDTIVDFAELRAFIDAPVKHYSSGMYLRLAFAVAAHVEPEILLVDEVLAVGDEAFQRKCLTRVDQLRRSGVTVVLVSHALDTVAEFADRVAWLDRGQLRLVGTPRSVVGAYRDAEGGEPASTTSAPA